VVFSVGEAEGKELYKRAAAQAWTNVEQRLRELVAASPSRKLELVEVQYDPMLEESLIEELPDQPKSSRPQAVEVAVRLRVTYELH
jgi:hypothetical protein